MLLNIIRRLRGYVDFEIIGRFPERFINLALKNGIGVFDVFPYKNGLKASVVVSDYRFIRPVARRAGVRLSIIKKYGLPFKIHRHRQRYGLVIGAVLFVLIISLMQNFLWEIEINGIKTLSETDVKKSLESAGVYEGVFKGSVDIHKIERELQLEYEKIGWMSVNLVGTRAEIEIKEKDSVPKKEYTSVYNNVFSDKDGVIKSISVRRGTALVKSGSAVSEGQLLVVGTFENAFGEVHLIDADATIFAETYYHKDFILPKTQTASVPVKLSHRYSVGIFGLDFPVTFGKTQGDYTLYHQNYRLKIGREFVPLTLSREQAVMYKNTCCRYSSTDAESILESKLALFKLFNLCEAESIATVSEFSETESQYRLSVRLTCLEEIGYKENLIVNSY